MKFVNILDLIDYYVYNRYGPYDRFRIILKHGEGIETIENWWGCRAYDVLYSKPTFYHNRIDRRYVSNNGEKFWILEIHY